MPTVVNRTIGSDIGDDYATIALWEADTDNDLVTLDEQHNGLLRNEAHSHTGNIFGAITDATRYRRLRPMTGHSFVDLYSAGSALRYGLNGARVDLTGGGAGFESYARIEDLQFQRTDAGNNNTLAFNTADATGQIVDRCIIEGQTSNNNNAVVTAQSTNNPLIRNTLIINRANSTFGNGVRVAGVSASATCINCTIVKPTGISSGSKPIALASGGVATAKNCALFGFATDSDAVTWTTSATDGASATGLTGGLTYANQFEATADGSHDYRLKTGANLIDTGTDLSGSDLPAADDIIGSARGASWDIGCWELIVAGGTTIACAVASIAVSGKKATVNAKQVLSAAAASVLVSGKQAVVNLRQMLTAAVAGVGVSGRQAALNAKTAIAATVAGVTVAGKVFLVLSPTVIAAATAGIAVAAKKATILTGNLVSCALAGITTATKAATVNAKTKLSAAVAGVVVTGKAFLVTSPTIVPMLAAVITSTAKAMSLTEIVRMGRALIQVAGKRLGGMAEQIGRLWRYAQEATSRTLSRPLNREDGDWRL